MKIRTAVGVALMATFLSTALNAQTDPCRNWNSLPQQDKDAAETAHVLYRDALKSGRMEEAFTNWEKAYSAAPAADGERASHYVDGRALYIDKFNKSTDEAQRSAFMDAIMRLYAEERQCYPAQAAKSLSTQVYDMFYTLRTPYSVAYPIAKEAISKGGDKTDFRVITPMGYFVSYMFSENLIDQAEARQIIERLRDIAAKNASGADAANYKQALDGAEQVIASVETKVFDCQYFKNKYEPLYKADPDNPEVYRDVYLKLAAGGCDKESDPLLLEIAAKDEAYRRKIFEENNPMFVARKLYDEGKVDEALSKFEELAKDADGETKGAIYLQMASIYRVDKNNFGRAREYARMAASAKPGWGKPYILIGDMYAASSSSCSSDPFQQRLVVIAAINQYSRAKSDPETASEAQGRINKFSGSLPTKEMLFERGIKEGESRSTGCWVGETVSVRAGG